MIELISENKKFLVLYKPSGMSMHNQSPSLSDYLKSLKKPEHFINRLDAETSGLVIVATEPQLHEPLQKSLQEGTKKYRALLRGQIDPDVIIEWSWPISDKSEGRRNPQGEKTDQINSLTRVQIIRSNKYFSEAELILKTGRQHQIRKHSAIARHPIVGDSRYNDLKYNQKINEMYKNDRLLLEAESLQFVFQGSNYFFEKKTLMLDRFFVS